MGPRLLFIGHLDTNGCRTLDYFPFLREQGADPAYRGLPRERGERLRLLDEAAEYDLVLLHRRLLKRGEFLRLRRNAKRLVYDFDDPVAARSSRHRRMASRMRARRFARTVGAADAVVVSNDALAGQARAVAPCERLLVVPSTCSGKTFPPKGAYPAADPVVLGWLGSAGTVRYLESLTPTLEALQADRPGAFVVRVVSNGFPDGVRYLLDCRTWTADREASDLTGFDVALLPLPEDAWTAARGTGKVFRYMAAGLPVVSAPVGTPRDVIREGEDGFFAADPAAWGERLRALVGDAALRERIGRAARASFEARHSLEVHVPRLWALFRELLGGG